MFNWSRGRTIGRGSTATVSLATAHPSGEIFAVKSAELAHSQSLQHEAKILSQLNHPCIVAAAGGGITTEDGREIFNLFVEFVAGGSVCDAIRRKGGRLEEPEIRSYTRDIVEGLAYLHSRRLVHCDIKGRNVLIGPDGAKIADLGCAREVDMEGGAVAGTPLFMAPEVARGEEQGFAADVWAVGCTVIEMATGSPPWPETKDPVSALFRIAYFTDVPEFPGWLSDQAKDFLGKCLRRNPGERWTADQLLSHPFVDGKSSVAKAVVGSVPINSPNSTLDLGFWDSLGESGSDQELTHFEYPANSPAERIRGLAGGDSIPQRPNWTWEENWVTVRGSEECEIPVGEEMGGPDSSGGDSDDQGLDCCPSSGDLVNDGCFEEGNSTGFMNKGQDYSTDLVDNIWFDEGIFVCSDDSFLCSKGLIYACKCNRDVVSCNLDLETRNSKLFFILVIAVTLHLLLLGFNIVDF